ncbi:hypothetical protein ABTM29_19190, partial [Acinetobacter baumannii]
LSASPAQAYTWGEDHTLRRWDLKTGQELACRSLPADANHPVASPDGKLVAFGVGLDGVRVQELATGKELHSFTVGEKNNNLNGMVTSGMAGMA